MSALRVESAATQARAQAGTDANERAGSGSRAPSRSRHECKLAGEPAQEEAFAARLADARAERPKAATKATRDDEPREERERDDAATVNDAPATPAACPHQATPALPLEALSLSLATSLTSSPGQAPGSAAAAKAAQTTLAGGVGAERAAFGGSDAARALTAEESADNESEATGATAPGPRASSLGVAREGAAARGRAAVDSNPLPDTEPRAARDTERVAATAESTSRTHADALVPNVRGSDGASGEGTFPLPGTAREEGGAGNLAPAFMGAPRRDDDARSDAPAGSREPSVRHETDVPPVSLLTLRHATYAEVDHPTLGRVHIDAEETTRGVDVSIRVAEPQTAVALKAIEPTLRAELDQSALPLGAFGVNVDARGDHRPDAQDSASDESSRHGTAAASAGASRGPSARSRVRIVL